MIRAIGITKAYGEGPSRYEALRGVDLEIAAGDILSIMGPSGSGKTTLLQTLSGIDRPDKGEIWAGETGLHLLNDNKLSDYRLHHMGFVFQSYHLIPVLSALENVELPLIASGTAAKQAAQLARQALHDVGLSGLEERYPSELSGGQNQRVSIARAIVARPKLLWADEPTGALDTKTAAQLMDLLLQINQEQQITVVIVTHDPKIAQATKRTLHMENGRIVSEDGGDRH
ncbi:ABC transporter ATP-binding protein [Paenibacillus spiritus]|uniref:ABC transporter ATP-binding protein n=1 Tax=Paenibacillus spiritus TaxID=2496557 RepID=A0A5J5G9V0_9BACL|nr:ABC transporter ATP-binding protein [Paenibacillus spiritus]KAA9004875.1 ABC transporter ATP-binding protein [Paenibacillus spiritus]